MFCKQFNISVRIICTIVSVDFYVLNHIKVL